MLSRAVAFLSVVVLLFWAEVGAIKPSPHLTTFHNDGGNLAANAGIATPVPHGLYVSGQMQGHIFQAGSCDKESAAATGLRERGARNCKTDTEMSAYISDNVYQSSVDFRTVLFKGKTFVRNDSHWCPTNR